MRKSIVISTVLLFIIQIPIFLIAARLSGIVYGLVRLLIGDHIGQYTEDILFILMSFGFVICNEIIIICIKRIASSISAIKLNFHLSFISFFYCVLFLITDKFGGSYGYMSGRLFETIGLIFLISTVVSIVIGLFLFLGKNCLIKNENR